jgi:hypothetical protein
MIMYLRVKQVSIYCGLNRTEWHYKRHIVNCKMGISKCGGSEYKLVQNIRLAGCEGEI